MKIRPARAALASLVSFPADSEPAGTFEIGDDAYLLVPSFTLAAPMHYGNFYFRARRPHEPASFFAVAGHDG